MKRKLCQRIACGCMSAALLLCLTACDGGGGKTPTKTDRPIQLTWASWQDPNVDAALIEKFMELHQDIEVTQITMAQDSWDQGLFNLNSTGDLPDAFTTFDLASATANGWTLDITEMYNADPYTQQIPEGIRQAGIYDGVRYGLATWQFPCVVFVNKTLFDSVNEPLPAADWTIEEMVNIARRLSNPSTYTFGLNEPSNYDGTEWLYRVFPVATTDNLYEWGFDPAAGTFDLTSWAEGYDLGKQLVDEQVMGNCLTDEQREIAYGSAATPLVETGKIAMSLDWFWTCAYMKSEVMTNNGIEWLVYPQPTDSGRIQSVIDLGAVSATTEHPQEAYELLRFMTFSAEGWAAKLDYCQENGLLPAMLPIADDEEVWTRVKTFFQGEDYAAVFDTLPQWVAEARKWTPGYGTFWDWTHGQDMFTQLIQGVLRAKDLVPQFNSAFKQYYDECMVLIGDRKS